MYILVSTSSLSDDGVPKHGSLLNPIPATFDATVPKGLKISGAQGAGDGTISRCIMRLAYAESEVLLLIDDRKA
jgi:hypothetical protein